MKRKCSVKIIKKEELKVTNCFLFITAEKIKKIIDNEKSRKPGVNFRVSTEKVNFPVAKLIQTRDKVRKKKDMVERTLFLKK